MILHAYPGRAFAKSNSGDFISHVGMDRIIKILIEWKEKLSHIIDYFELKKDDYNISLGRYIHTGDTETYRPPVEIIDELNMIEVETKEVGLELRRFLEKVVI